MKLNPNDAPKGFIAQDATSGCAGCHFDSLEPCQYHWNTRRCRVSSRKDRHSVIFVKRPAKPKKDKDVEWLRCYIRKHCDIGYDIRWMRRIAKRLEKMP